MLRFKMYAIAIAAYLAIAGAIPARAQTVIEEVWQLAQTQFHDPAMNGTDWQAVKARYLPMVTKSENTGARAKLINAMLDELQTSHTRYCPPDDPMLPVLLGVYSGNPDLKELISDRDPDGTPTVEGIGVFASEQDGSYFATSILNGSSGEKAGLKTGDELVLADGAPFDPWTAFKGKADKVVKLEVRRERGGPLMSIVVPVARMPALAALDDATRNSVRLIEHGGKTILYVRFWSFAGFIADEIAETAPLDKADRMVIDARGLVGGGGPNLLELLDPRIGQVCASTRKGQNCGPRSMKGRTVLLVDERTRSAAELLAYGFKKTGFGPIVGSRTAGAVTGGRLFPLSDGGALYLAVSGLTVDGIDLEGKGVGADKVVEFDPRFAAGQDPRMDAALEAASRL